jgi:hypothetical protein
MDIQFDLLSAGFLFRFRFPTQISLYWTLGWSNLVGTITRAGFTFGFVLLFPLHASILEPVGEARQRELPLIDCSFASRSKLMRSNTLPYLDLALGEAECMCNFNASSAC